MTMDAVVEFEYQAEQEDELTLKVGEVISNVQTAEGGWWEGELNGKKGMFPENFVKLVKKRESPPSKKMEKREATQRKSVRELASKFKDGVPLGAAPQKKKENKKYCKVLFDYKKENDDELEMKVGELVEFHKQVEEGWWEGTLNGRHGVFPSNFVEMVEEEQQPAPTQAPEEKPVTTGAAAPPPASSNDKEDNFHTIKGKKVVGVGLGNIFGEGPIKLRSTGGSKKEEPPVKEAPKPTKPPEPEPIPAAAKREKQTTLERAVVRFSYAAEQPDELQLLEGQVIRILDKELEDEGWWKGELNGKEGVFPDNFVELLPHEEPSKPKKPPPPSSSVKQNSQQHHKIGDGDDKNKPDPAPAPSSIKKPPGPPPIGKKPSSQKFGEGALPPGPKPDAVPPAKPLSGPPGRGKEDHSDHHLNNDDSGGFDNLESSGHKLTHLTANRNKGPKKRPPSTVLTLNDGVIEKDTADLPDDGRVNSISATEKAQPSLPAKDLKHSEPSPTQQLHHPREPSPHLNRGGGPAPPSSSSSISTNQQPPQRPSEPTSAPPSQTNTASMHQTNKLIERLQKELEELKSNSVSRSEYNALRKEHDNLKTDFETLRTQHSKKLLVLMNEVDDEKKLRLSTQVEIERVKKLLAESHV